MASLARTILEEHLTRGELVPGQEIAISVDQTLVQDATGTMAMMQFELFGHDRVEVETAVVYVDHNILQIDFKNPDDHRFLQAMAAKYGVWFSRPGNGICHYIHCERFAVPGKTLIGADSHTTQSGSCGMIAIGAGGLDVAVCMAGHSFELPCPKIVGVFLENELARPWIQAKDVILELLRRRGVRGGRGAIFEFTGPGVATLSYTERGTICNMIAELGATGAIFPSDDETKRWLEEQERGEDFVALETGDTGDFDEEEHVDLAAARPARRQAVEPRQRRPGRGGRGNGARAGLHRLLGQLVVRGPGARRRRPPRQRDLREADLGDRDSGLSADPRPDHAVGHLRRPDVRRPADARARLRALRRHGPGAAVGGELAADVQPELPRPERDGRRSGVSVLTRGRRGLDVEGRDRRPARAAGTRAGRAPARAPGRRPGAHPRAGAGGGGGLDRDPTRPEHQAAAGPGRASRPPRAAGADRRSRRHLDRRPLARRRHGHGLSLQRARDRRVHVPAS